jgi:hypothetical protein
MRRARYFTLEHHDICVICAREVSRTGQQVGLVDGEFPRGAMCQRCELLIDRALFLVHAAALGDRPGGAGGPPRAHGELG